MDPAQRAGLREIMAASVETHKINELPRTAFAIQETREYPLADVADARNALAHAAQHEDGERRAEIVAAVYRRYPQLTRDVGSLEEVASALEARALSADEKRKVKTARTHLVHGRHVKAFGVLHSMLRDSEPDPNDPNEPNENYLGLP